MPAASLAADGGRAASAGQGVARSAGEDSSAAAGASAIAGAAQRVIGAAGQFAAVGGAPAVAMPAPSLAGPAGMGAAGSAAMSGSAGHGDCGTRTGMRGKSTRSVEVSGQKRSFIAYLPDALQPGTPAPFVYVFHGANQTGQQLFAMTEYAALADKEGIALVFPDGQGVSSASNSGSLTPWNVSDGPALCGLGTLVSNGNPVDFAFIDAIRTDIEKDQCIDPQHTFATGFSMGGYFTHHIACDRTDFRAAAPHSGGTLADLGSCKSNHLPIIIFHGTADPLIAGNCDDPTLSPDPSFSASATLWAKKNGCKTTYQSIPTDGPMGKGQCLLYDGCPADGQVEMCSFTDMAHAWAGSTSCENCIGSGTGWASATQLQWNFYKKYAW